MLHLSSCNAEATEQTARTLFGVRLFFGPAPLNTFFALALPPLIGNPITRVSHARMREQLGATSQ